LNCFKILFFLLFKILTLWNLVKHGKSFLFCYFEELKKSLLEINAIIVYKSNFIIYYKQLKNDASS